MQQVNEAHLHRVTEYTFRCLAKIRNKTYESYVIQRILHRLNDPSIKFVTQQYVQRPDGSIALTDLYFPQFDLHIEVDEPHHTQQAAIAQDKLREYDIIQVTGHEIRRIPVAEKDHIQELHCRIDDVIAYIQARKQQLIAQQKFTPWDLHREFSAELYLERGYIDIEDQVVFKHVHEICNCFGYEKQLSQVQSGGIIHAHDPHILIWWPKLYPNGAWDNHISADGQMIIEKSLDLAEMHSSVPKWNRGPQQRIVFAHVKDCLNRRPLYRFLGLYQLCQPATIESGGIWQRIATRVPTARAKTTQQKAS